MNKWIAVMAGTPVDTEMGVEVLRQHGLAARAYAMAADSLAQTAFQNQDTAAKTAKLPPLEWPHTRTSPSVRDAVS